MSSSLKSLNELTYDELCVLRDLLQPIIPNVVIRGRDSATSMSHESGRIDIAFLAGRRSIVDEALALIASADRLTEEKLNG